MPETLIVNRNYTGAITRMLNKAKVSAFAEGDSMQVWVVAMPQSAAAVRRLLTDKGFRFQESKQTYPSTRAVFSVTQKVV